MSVSAGYSKYYRKPSANQKQARNALQGKINRAAGRAFEERIDIAFEYYRKRGRAVIEKTPEPTKILSMQEGGKFIGVYTQKAQPDYKGFLKGGKAVLFEAKFTATDRLRSEIVNEKQTQYLNEALSVGAECWIIGGFKGGGAYLIPWEVWRAMKDRFGRKYVTEEDLEAYKIRESRAGLLLVLE